MIIRTPLRLSLIGGGSDLRYFYKINGGKSLGFSIQYYNYIFFSKSHNGLNHIISDKENIETENLLAIKDNLLRNVLMKFKLKKQKIFIFSDLPYGTGLGSSSAMSVGLIHGISNIKKMKLSKNEIAEKAFEIEEKTFGSTIGKQDHFMSCFGNINLYGYNKDSTTQIKKLNLPKDVITNLESHMLLIRTGGFRNASEILYDQKSNLINDSSKFESMKNLISYIPDVLDCLSTENYKLLGQIISETWEIKKTFSKFISNKNINDLYNKLNELGIYGGKLLGAGSSGYFLVICNSITKNKIINFFGKDKILTFKIDLNGTAVNNN